MFSKYCKVTIGMLNDLPVRTLPECRVRNQDPTWSRRLNVGCGVGYRTWNGWT